VDYSEDFLDDHYIWWVLGGTFSTSKSCLLSSVVEMEDAKVFVSTPKPNAQVCGSINEAHFFCQEQSVSGSIPGLGSEASPPWCFFPSLLEITHIFYLQRFILVNGCWKRVFFP
jgi:hypothetical protein